ncbi:hypothetical protein [Rhizobium lusitanum]|uniref:Uncharacterized protein n=1 Tax=Rhizobium lusitanum TaxID=293958 RepID=A0A7X0ISK9_9HYPH|nr:hypothetical protein [Rhizobium lusitanum]MBB6486059.1 hypothetical protein [Rhizobium lusitanum]
MGLLLPFLCIAIGFSWADCSSIFTSGPQMSHSRLALATVSTSIFLCAIGLSFANCGVLAGATLIACGMTIALALGRTLSPLWSLLISAAGFAIYLHGVID